MKILITGASGLLGRSLMTSLSKNNTVLGLSHSRRKAGLLQFDVRNPEGFTDVIRKFEPDLVVHSAAYRDPDFCEQHPDEALRLNVEPVKTICHAVPASTRIVLISSDYVFDGEKPPYRERDERAPVNFYGKTKLMAEDVIAARGNGLALRVPVLIGRDDTFEQSGFIYNMVKLVRSGREVEVNDIHIRYPTWTRDVGRALRFAVDNEIQGILHFSGGAGGTQYDFALQTAEILGESTDHIKPLTIRGARRAARPLNSQLSCDLIKSLGFEDATAYEAVLLKIMAD